MKRMIFVIVTLLLAPAQAPAGPHLSLHIVPASDEICALVEDSLRCADFNTRGRATDRQFVYVVLSEFDDLTQMRFGIRYDPGVRITDWIPCHGGAEFTVPKWPASGSGATIAFDRCMEPRGPDGLLILGALVAEPNSWGRVWIDDYDAIHHASVSSCRDGAGESAIVRQCALGMARVDGSYPGRNTCGPCE